MTDSIAHARTHANETRPGCQHQMGCRCDPPHHLRCDEMKDGERCRKGSGHVDEHVFPKPTGE